MTANPAVSEEGEPRLKVSAYRWLLGLAMGVVVLDQLTKGWIMAVLPAGTWQVGGPDYLPQAIPVIPDFFYLVHVLNDGAAWSILRGKGFLLGLFGLGALAGIWVFRRALELHRYPQQWLFGLVAGGIAGNVIDRLRWGHVVDFLDFHFGSYRYPSFNVADAAICVGVVGLIIYSQFFGPKTSPGGAAGADGAGPPVVAEPEPAKSSASSLTGSAGGASGGVGEPAEPGVSGS